MSAVTSEQCRENRDGFVSVTRSVTLCASGLLGIPKCELVGYYESCRLFARRRQSVSPIVPEWQTKSVNYDLSMSDRGPESWIVVLTQL